MKGKYCKLFNTILVNINNYRYFLKKKKQIKNFNMERIWYSKN